MAVQDAGDLGSDSDAFQAMSQDNQAAFENVCSECQSK